MRAQSFFYICAGLFLLVAAYAMGARSVEAQATTNSGVTVLEAVSLQLTQTTQPGPWVLLNNGDVYARDRITGNWSYLGSPISGGTVAVDPATMGELKANFK